VEGTAVLSPGRRALYACGTFGPTLLQQTVLLWVFYFYAPPDGAGLPARAAPVLLGVAMGGGRVIDAVVDPLIGHWSDRCRGRGGRRRPFVLVGTPALAAVFALIWRPPDGGMTLGNAVYLAALLAAFFFLFTLVLNPYMALLPEITAPGPDRVRTAAWQAVSTLAGTACAFVASAQLSTRLDFPAMALILAPAGALPMVVAALAVREIVPAAPGPPFAAALRAVLGNRRFRIFIAGFALLWTGLSAVNLAIALIATVLMGLPRAAVGTVLGLSVAVMLVVTPGVSAAAQRWGAARVLRAAMIWTAGVLPALAAIGLWPVPLSAQAQGYAVIAIAAPAVAALFILPNALLADIAGEAARRTGQRTEGMFFAFQGLILNGTTAVASGLLGVALQRLPYAVALRLVPLVAAGCVAAGTLVFRRYPGPSAGWMPRVGAEVQGVVE
jgi:GPH family glycoside/pentoside/hexuronide:cation symporter